MQTAVLAESMGIDAVYLGESPTPLNADPWTTMGAIAASTTRLHVGPVIANLLPTYRSTVAVARHGAALATLSDGRFEFRTGVGAAEAAGRSWWEPAGVPYPDYQERLRQTDEQLGMLRRLWEHEAVELGDGPYTLALSHPPIEITVAASTASAFQLADRHADRWETSFATIDEVRGRLASAPAGLTSSLEIDGFMGTDADPDRVWRAVERDRAGENLSVLRERALVGGPTDVRRQLTSLAEAGIDQLVVALHEPHDAAAISLLTEARPA